MNAKSRAIDKQSTISVGENEPRSASKVSPLTSADEVTTRISNLSEPIVMDEKVDPQKTQPPDAVMELLRTSHSELDHLFAETQTMHERSWRVIHSLMEDLKLRTSQTITMAVGSFDKEIRELVSFEKAAMLESLDVEAEARLAARTDAALAKMKEARDGLEGNLKDRATEKERSFETVMAKTAEELQRREATFRVNLQSHTKRTLDELKAGVDEIAKNLRQMEVEVSTEFGKSAEQKLQGYKLRLEDLGEKAINAAQTRIAEITQSSVASVAKYTREIVERELSESFIQGVRRRLDYFAELLKTTNSDALDPEQGK
jgi:hypothetical protein